MDKKSFIRLVPGRPQSVRGSRPLRRGRPEKNGQRRWRRSLPHSGLTLYFVNFHLAIDQCDQIGRNLAVWLLLIERFLHFYTNEEFQGLLCLF